MNAILSIKPQFVKEIVAGRKRFEYRKSVFKQPVEKVFIYASAPISKVVGEFQPVDVISGTPAEVWKRTKQYSGVKKGFYDEYFHGRSTAYAIVIQNLVMYEEALTLPKDVKAPQSYCYIDRV